MKMIGWNRGWLTAIAAFLVSGGIATAQEQFELGSFFDKWFVQGSAGIHSTTDVRVKGGISGLDKPTLASGAAVGKWFSPQFGARLSLDGARLSMQERKIGFGYVHTDLLWNATNTFSTYRRDRFWEVAPYFHMGFIHEFVSGDRTRVLNNEYAGGIGFMNLFRLHDHVSLTADFRATLLTEDASVVSGIGYTGIATALAGVCYTFGDGVWRTRRQASGRKGELSNGFWDNWFFAFGGGVNGITGIHRWDSRAALAMEASAGKWFSPQFGARLGWQGLRFSRRGTAPVSGVQVTELDGFLQEDFGFAYVHGDFLWNLTNTVSRYREDRGWNLAPYAHMGLLEEYRNGGGGIFATEFAAGAGLLNTFRLTPELDLYADLRGFVLRGAASGDRATGVSLAGSALVGGMLHIGKSVFDSFQSEGTPVREEDRNWAVSANLVDYARLGTVQAAIQYGISRHVSIDAAARLSGRSQRFSAGARWWPWYIYSGWWVKGLAQIENKEEAYGAGFSLGYSLLLSRWLNLDLGIGGWGGRKGTGDRSWFLAPNDITAALMFVF